MNFDTLGLRVELINAITELGFQAPMPIQEKAIPTLLAGEQDFVGLAETGTGKTGAFGLPLIQRIDLAVRRPQGVVICPTRELCLQITNDLKHYSKYLKGIEIVAVYGGASISNQIRELKKGSQIIVATPGRLLDLIRRKAVKLSNISHVILDEADEMLNMGFQEDINAILDKIPENRRTWLFSATMPASVAKIAQNYLTDPLEVTLGGRNRSPKAIVHTCYVIREKDRYTGLKRIIDFTSDMFALVFCRTRQETRNVAEALFHDGYPADALHGELSQAQRNHVMQKFRQRNIRILVATDVAARGLDVDDITHVIHYKLPDESEIYTHRSGRTARAGKSGASLVLINIKEKHRVHEVARRCKISFDFGKIPDGKAICKKQLYVLVEKITQMKVNPEEIEAYLPEIYQALAHFSKEELIQRFVSSEFKQFLEYYRDANDINVKVSLNTRKEGKTTKRQNDRIKGKQVQRGKQTQRGKQVQRGKQIQREKQVQQGKQIQREKQVQQGKQQTQRFFINAGRLDKINEGAIVRLICDQTGIQSSKIGHIDLKREFSFFEVEKSAAGRVRNSFHKTRLDGRLVEVCEATEMKKSCQKKRRNIDHYGGNHLNCSKRSH